MRRYDEATQKKALEMAKNGSSLKEIQRQLGPNPSAIKRYAKKAGVTLPKKEAAKKKWISITELYENYKKYLDGIKKAPVFICVFLDLEKGAASFTNGNVMNLVTNGYLYNSLRDSLFLCVENMLLEATALGLGSLYFELPSASKTPVNKLFNIDNSNEFFTCLPIGYADEEPIGDERKVEDFLLDYD